ncbi:putative cleavage and polyadenylation specificity factor subunit 4-like protein isoform X1 [Camelus bactrianus]|uniref:Cleavage and polyadenylation specificity factor subunit 4-like protein isoform X1 n=1 Tax=Camelus bactrianus TaxID=9837 RepID=A0AC58NPI7_CAMBA
MQEVIAGLERFTFTFEKDVEMQKGTGLLPFQGMDKSGSAVCNFFAKGLCEKAGRVASFPHSCPLNLYKTCSAIQDHFLCLKRGLATAREMLQQAPRFLAHPNGGCARSGTTEGRRWWCASTGFVASARRATSASSCTSMTSPGCPSATSTPSSNWLIAQPDWLSGNKPGTGHLSSPRGWVRASVSQTAEPFTVLAVPTEHLPHRHAPPPALSTVLLFLTLLLEENVTLLPSMENQHRLLAVESHCTHMIMSFRSVVPEMVLCGQVWTHAPHPDSRLCPPRGYMGGATASSRLV